MSDKDKAEPLMTSFDLRYAFESPKERISGMGELSEPSALMPSASPFVGYPPDGYKTWLDWVLQSEEATA